MSHVKHTSSRTPDPSIATFPKEKGGGREKKGWTGTSKQAFGVVCFHAGPLNQRIIEKSDKYAH
jgi:hypothetical protein